MNLPLNPKTRHDAGPGRLHPRNLGTRLAVVVVAPAVAYGVIRPIAGSDAAALAAAGAIPLVYNVVLALCRRRIDRLGVLSATSFALACLVSVLVGGSSLPLKLKWASVTFVIGLVLLVAVLSRRPIPLGRLVRVPTSSRSDSVLGALLGGFLMLHALLHLALVILLSTQLYVVASPIIDWGSLALGLLGIRAYVRQLRPETWGMPTT
jgi:hypothetical protein